MFTRSNVFFLAVACFAIGQPLKAEKNSMTTGVIKMMSEERCMRLIAAMGETTQLKQQRNQPVTSQNSQPVRVASLANPLPPQ